MTDKQMIVDNVDVSGCEYYFNGCCSVNGYVDCTDTPDCCYKQLKRKEQECERLRFPMQDTNYAILVKEEFKEYKKLKQTLIEINEIVTNFYKTGFLRTDNGSILINNNTCVETFDKILQKISECEGK